MFDPSIHPTCGEQVRVFLGCDELVPIQEEQLSGDGERMFTKYWLTAPGLPRNSVVRSTDRLDISLAVDHGHKQLNQTNI